MFINLNDNRQYIQSYIDLRNKYTDELMTKVITVQGTIEWFENGQGGAIHCLIEDDGVVAAVIVHKRKEVTIFSDKAGMGDKLLKEAERMARNLGYDKLWARVKDGNYPAHAAFDRNGYVFANGIYVKKVYDYGIRPEAREYPMMIVLSFSYACNARCPNCPYNNSDIRTGYKDARYMSWEVFKKIVDESGPYGTVLRLSGGGEPTLHKDLEKFVKYASEKGCKVSMITNGSSDVSRFIDYFDMVEYSVDAGGRDEYSIVRPGLDWDYLNENIKKALAYRKKTKLICSIINQTGVDVEKAVFYWSTMDFVQVRKYLTWGYNENNSADDSPYLEPGEPCPWLFERLNIDSRGDVTYCGEDIAFKYKFANIMDRGIRDIWLGKEFSELREKHLGKRVGAVKMCMECPDMKFRTWEYNYWKMRENANNNITA